MRLTLFLIILFLPGWAWAQASKPQSAPVAQVWVSEAFQLPLKTAQEVASRARMKAAALQKEVSIAVVDASGEVILLSRGDGVGPHNTEAARRKAYTSLSTKTNSLLLSRNTRTNPDTENLAHLPELLLLGGGSPLWYKGKVIGAIGVAGGGGPENDDAIAAAGQLPEAGITTIHPSK
ncbi:heme-binding protein [Rufibacter soli]